MTLEEWLKKNNLKKPQLALLLGLNKYYFSKLGPKGIGMNVCLQIVSRTNGEVTLADLRSEWKGVK